MCNFEKSDEEKTSHEWDLLLEEYRTLRTEILNKMDKQYQIIGLGIGGVSILLGFALQDKIYGIFFILPLIIISAILLFDSEKTAILNAGEYIRTVIEEPILSHSRFLGWERWLLENKDKCKAYDYIEKVSLLILYILNLMSIYGILNYGTIRYIDYIINFRYVDYFINIKSEIYNIIYEILKFGPDKLIINLLEESSLVGAITIILAVIYFLASTYIFLKLSSDMRARAGFLFSFTNKQIESELSTGSISKNLKDLFKENKCELSDSITIKTEVKWKMVDKNQVYVVEKEGERLDVRKL
jgi:hypothetical protein